MLDAVIPRRRPRCDVARCQRGKISNADAYGPLPRAGPAHQQFFGHHGTWSRPTVMPMDAYREGEQFVVHFDLPGVAAESIDLDVATCSPCGLSVRPCTPRMPICRPPSGPVGCSAASCSSATPSTPIGSSRLRRGGVDPADPGGREGQAPQDRDRRKRLGQADHHLIPLVSGSRCPGTPPRQGLPGAVVCMLLGGPVTRRHRRPC